MYGDTTERETLRIIEAARLARSQFDKGRPLSDFDNHELAGMSCTFPAGSEPEECAHALELELVELASYFDSSGPTIYAWAHHVYEEARRRIALAHRGD